MPLKVNVKEIQPDDATCYLVGPEGLVWVQPAIGDAHIIAARNETERTLAAVFVKELLDMGLVPYGLPLNQKVVQAMFGGSAIRDCQWVRHDQAPAPQGDEPLPTRAAVIKD